MELIRNLKFKNILLTYLTFSNRDYKGISLSALSGIISKVIDKYGEDQYKAIIHLLDEPFLDKKVLLERLEKYEYKEKALEGDDVKSAGYAVSLVDLTTGEFKKYIISTVVGRITTLLHEFYHTMGFSKFDVEKQVKYSGFIKFFYEDDEVSIGRGIEEGFVTYMTSLKFNDGKLLYRNANEVVSSYTFCSLYAKALTSIMGIDVMKNNYFNKGLEGLMWSIYDINHDMGDTNDFIKNMDRLCTIDGESKGDLKRVQEITGYVDSFLLRLSILKYGDDRVMEFLPKSFRKIEGTVQPVYSRDEFGEYRLDRPKGK